MEDYYIYKLKTIEPDGQNVRHGTFAKFYYNHILINITIVLFGVPYFIYLASFISLSSHYPVTFTLLRGYLVLGIIIFRMRNVRTHNSNSRSIRSKHSIFSIYS